MIQVAAKKNMSRLRNTYNDTYIHVYNLTIYIIHQLLIDVLDLQVAKYFQKMEEHSTKIQNQL